MELEKILCNGTYEQEEVKKIKYVCEYSMCYSKNDYDKLKKCPLMDKEYEIPIDWGLSYYFYTCKYRRKDD